MRHVRLSVFAALGVAGVAYVAYGQGNPRPDLSGPRTLNPGAFPYPDSMDSVKAAPGQHKLRYEDSHIRLLEVTYLPHTVGDAFHGHPYPSVFAFPSARPAGRDVRLDAGDPAPRTEGSPPPGMSYPRCTTMVPQMPHRPENTSDFPDHFYRVEFKRVDGDEFKTKWATWYPYLKQRTTVWEWLKSSGERPFGQAAAPSSKPVSATARTLNPEGFPYPDSYDSVAVAPGQHWLRYEDENVRFIEVMYRPGERGDGLHGHPYSSVFFMDSPFARVEDEHLEKGPLNEGQGRGGPPPNMKYPMCSTMGPQSPHRPHNIDTTPIHFYRIEFKRLDGEGIKDHWREWYPQMATGQQK